jgi:hypothetical protein
MWNAAAWSIIKISRKFSGRNVLALTWAQEAHSNTAEDCKNNTVNYETYSGWLTSHGVGHESTRETSDCSEHERTGYEGKEEHGDGKSYNHTRH